MAYRITLLILLICNHAGALPRQLKDLREQARRMTMSTSCAHCHDPSRSSNSQALAIYDLSQAYWSSTMSDRQLRRFVWSLTEATREELRAMGASSLAKPLTKNQRTLLGRFLKAELKFRNEKPDHRLVEIEKIKNPGLHKLLYGQQSDCPL